MNIKILYEDNNVLVVDKPAGIVVFPEKPTRSDLVDKTLIYYLIEKYPKLVDVGRPPRYGIVHRLDKDTSGILLVAKNNETLIFFQNQFKNRGVEKKYIALVTGTIKEEKRVIETLIGRSPSDPRKQKAYLLQGLTPQYLQNTPQNKRLAITEYKVLRRFEKYTLLEVKIKTGRKHQIRCHLAYIHHPIAGDKMYGFKDSPLPEGLNRQFLHASYTKIQLPAGRTKEFSSELPEELSIILERLKIKD